MKKLVISALYLLTLSVMVHAQQWKSVKQELLFKDPPFEQCHASTLVELANGTLMAAWFGGTSESAKDVCIWNSVGSNGRWTPPFKIATGIINDSLRYPCWNPVLFKLNNGKLLLFYKVKCGAPLAPYHG